MSATSHSRVGRWSRGVWWADRHGTVYLGQPPREILAEHGIELDDSALARCGVTPADLRTEAEQVADLNALLDEPPLAPLRLAPPIAAAVADTLILAFPFWLAFALWYLA